MKTMIFAALAVGLACVQAQPLAGDWKFIKTGVTPTADTSSWETVTIPHTWNAVDGQDGGGKDMQSRDGYYRGPAGYAKTFTTPANAAGKRVFLRFEGVSSVAEVYLNGHRLGEHMGAFGAFAFEVTSYLNPGANNELRVLASNAWRDDLTPLSGDFPVFGGIYRPVHLLVKEQVTLSPLRRGSHGVYLRQKNVSQSHASLSVTSLLDNGKSTGADVVVEYQLLDADGIVVASAQDTQTIPAEDQAESSATLGLANPHLWNGRMDPYLYTLQVIVNEGAEERDRFTIKQGFRYFEVDPVQGFMLNGQPYQLWGVNRHQDYEDKGWALTNAEHDRDIELIDEMGARSIRLAHYPQAEYFFEKCDEKGILVTAELPVVDCITNSPEFTENTIFQMNEIIDLYGNFTSVFAYGLYNEMYHKPSPAAEPLLNTLHALCKQRDPSRYTYGGTNQGATRALNDTTDLLAFNGYPGWYGGNSQGMAGFLDQYLQKNPQRGVAVSEYGAGASIQHHETQPKKPDPSGHWHPEEYQALHHEIQFEIMQANPRVWGTYVWNMFDFSSVWRNEGDRPGINDKGLVTHDRNVRKDAFYFYKANWNEQPMVHLTSKRHDLRPEASTVVKVYANLPSVTLTVNGIEIGNKTPNHMHIVSWENVPLQEGLNTIVASAEDGQGQLVQDEAIWEHDPSAPVAGPDTPKAIVQGLFSASDAEVGNPPKHAFDGDPETRWATSHLGAWLAREFEAPTEVGSISISWYRGAERKYQFEVQTSADGLSWQTVFAGESYKQGGMEKYLFDQTHTLNHIRIICNGFSGSTWSSIIDVEVKPPGSEQIETSYLQDFEDPSSIDGWYIGAAHHAPLAEIVQENGELLAQNSNKGLVWSFFRDHAEAVVLTEAQDTIELKFKIRFANASGVGGDFALRFGLFDSGSQRRISDLPANSNSDSSFTDWTGVLAAWGSGAANSSRAFFRTGPNSNPCSTAGGVQSMGASFAGVNFTDGNSHEAFLRIQRTAEGTVQTIFSLGQSAVTLRSFLWPQNIPMRFDSFAVLNTPETGSSQFAIDDFLITTRLAGTSLPPVSTLRISEIQLDGTNSFIEIENHGSDPVDLAGLSLTEGVAMTIESGTLIAEEKFITSPDPRNFPLIQAYPYSGTLVAGGFITLEDRYGRVIERLEIAPENDPNWPLTKPSDRTYTRIPGTDHWRISAASGGSPGGSDGVSLSQWQAAHGLRGDPAITDSDNDGVSDLIEYGLGTDPTDPQSKPEISVAPATSRFVYSRAIAADDVLVELETSSDLQLWTTAESPIISAIPLGNRLQLSHKDLIPDKKRFARLRVTLFGSPDAP